MERRHAVHRISIEGHDHWVPATERELLIVCGSVLDHEYDAPMPGAARVLRVAKELGLVRRRASYVHDVDEPDVDSDDNRATQTAAPLIVTLLGNEWMREKGWA